MRFPATVRRLLQLTLGLMWLLSTLGSAPPRTTAIGLAVVPPGFTDISIASVSGPTAIAFTPDNRMLVTTQAGQLRLYNLNGSLISTALNFTTQWPARRICSDFERGLLGVAVDPNFASNNHIYLYYTAVVTPTAFTNCDSGAGRNSPNVVNRVSRFTLTGTTVPTTTEQILVDNIRSLNGNHNGGDVNFGKDGLLYISAGDSGTGGSLARSRTTLNGKILRVNPDGTPAGHAPWVGEAGSRRCGTPGPQYYSGSGNCREILNYGLRNPFRFAMDPTTIGNEVRFFINDVGQGTWEEVDVGQAGVDYGWNVREGPCLTGQSCTPPNPINSGYADPIDWYNQNIGCNVITGGAFVPANVWPGYDGSYLFGDGGCGRVFRLVPNGSGGYARAGSDFATGLNGVRHFEFGPYQSTQALYYATGGAVRRIALNNSAPTAVISADPTFGGVLPLTVNFSAAGSSDPNGDPLTYEWDFGDTQTANTTIPTTSHNYQNAGVYTATLVVRDNNGFGSAPDSVQIQPGNTPPSASIAQPSSGVTFAVGDVIPLAGSATDAELPVTLRWDILLWHIDSRNPGNAHTHTLQTTNDANGQFTAPAPEDVDASELSHVEVRLTATDAWGLSAVVTRTLQPRRVDLTFATQPSGLRVTINGFNATGPQTLTAWENWALNVAAPPVQTQGANAWAFDHWEDNSTSAARTIATPAATTIYTATFIPAKRTFLPAILK